MQEQPNNWVVAGSRSASGYPLMANDPHRVQAAPSLRYWVHLVGPGWNVIGGGEPVLPGVSIGHNEYGAWGLKKFMGREFMGVLRTTFIIGKDGRLKHVMDKVKTKSHHDDVMALIRELDLA